VDFDNRGGDSSLSSIVGFPRLFGGDLRVAELAAVSSGWIRPFSDVDLLRKIELRAFSGVPFPRRGCPQSGRDLYAVSSQEEDSGGQDPPGSLRGGQGRGNPPRDFSEPGGLLGTMAFLAPGIESFPRGRSFAP